MSLKINIWYVWYHEAFWRLRLNQNKISNPFSSIVRMSDLQSCYISTSAASVIHENFTLLKIVFYPKLKLSSPNSTCYVRVQFKHLYFRRKFYCVKLFLSVYWENSFNIKTLKPTTTKQLKLNWAESIFI